MNDQNARAAEVGDRRREFLLELWQEDAYDTETIVVASHSELVIVMTQMFGGERTARVLERAADRVRSLPPFAEAQLAAAAPAGTA